MTGALAVLGQVLAIGGAAVFVVAALGLVRLPDPYTRISAVATAAGVGLVMVVVGALLVDPNLPDAVKVSAAVVLQLLTSAVGGMALARSAVLTRHEFAPGTDLDGLRPDDSD